MALIKFALLVSVVAVAINSHKLPCDKDSKAPDTAEAKNIKANLTKSLTNPKTPIKKDLFEKALKDDASYTKRKPVNTGAVPIVPLGAEKLTKDEAGKEVSIVPRKPIYGGPQPILPYSTIVGSINNGGESGNPLGNLILNGTGGSEVLIPPRNPVLGGPEPIVPYNGAIDETSPTKNCGQSGNPLGNLILNNTNGSEPNISNNGGDETGEEVLIVERNPIYGGPQPIVPYSGTEENANNGGEIGNPLGDLILNDTDDSEPKSSNNGQDDDDDDDEVYIPPRIPIDGGSEPIVPYDGTIDEVASPKKCGQSNNPLDGLILNGAPQTIESKEP